MVDRWRALVEGEGWRVGGVEGREEGGKLRNDERSRVLGEKRGAAGAEAEAMQDGSEG